jgi:hypothetical protein
MEPNVGHQRKTTEKCEIIFPGAQKVYQMSDKIRSQTIKEEVGKGKYK